MSCGLSRSLKHISSFGTLSRTHSRCISVLSSCDVKGKLDKTLLKPKDSFVTKPVSNCQIRYLATKLDQKHNVLQLEKCFTAEDNKYLKTHPDPDVRKLLYCGVTWKNEMYLYGNQRIAHLHGYKFSVVDQNFNFYRGACSAMNDEYIFLCFNIVEDMDKECRRATDPLGYFTEVAPSNKYHKRIPISASESK